MNKISILKFIGYFILTAALTFICSFLNNTAYTLGLTSEKSHSMIELSIYFVSVSSNLFLKYKRMLDIFNGSKFLSLILTIVLSYDFGVIASAVSLALFLLPSNLFVKKSNKSNIESIDDHKKDKDISKAA